jgi:hypothetical protein
MQCGQAGTGHPRRRGRCGTCSRSRWGGRPPRKSTSWWAGVVRERVDGGGMELWHCEHRHATEREALGCSVEWAKAKAAQDLAEYQPPPSLSVLRDAVELELGMPVEFRDPWDPK